MRRLARRIVATCASTARSESIRRRRAPRVLEAVLRDQTRHALAQGCVDDRLLPRQPGGQRTRRTGIGECVVAAAARCQAPPRGTAQAATVVDRHPRPARAQAVCVAQCLGGVGCAPAGGERPGVDGAVVAHHLAHAERGRMLGESQPQVDGLVRPLVAHVPGRPPAADQIELAERRLELRPRGRRVDLRERGERALDARRLPARAEVRAHAGAQVAGLADVERLAEAVAHHVDAGPCGQAGREVPLLARAPRRSQRQRHHVLRGLRPALLGEPDQARPAPRPSRARRAAPDGRAARSRRSAPTRSRGRSARAARRAGGGRARRCRARACPRACRRAASARDRACRRRRTRCGPRRCCRARARAAPRSPDAAGPRPPGRDRGCP